jgi:hypothetical protein
VEETVRQIEEAKFLQHSGIRFPQNPWVSCAYIGLCLDRREMVDFRLTRQQGANLLTVCAACHRAIHLKEIQGSVLPYPCGATPTSWSHMDWAAKPVKPLRGQCSCFVRWTYSWSVVLRSLCRNKLSAVFGSSPASLGRRSARSAESSFVNSARSQAIQHLPHCRIRSDPQHCLEMGNRIG